MKKIFYLLLMSLCLSVSVNAAITNLEVDVDRTNADFYWQGDTTVSKVYELELLEGSEFGYIAAGAWYSSVFDMGQGGWMWMSSDLLLTYGQNYVDLESAGAKASVVAAWKANWDANVDTVNNAVTLKPGVYVIVITGYDAAYENETESKAYKFFEIPGIASGTENVQDTKSATKFVDRRGNIYIRRNDYIYDVRGQRIH